MFSPIVLGFELPEHHRCGLSPLRTWDPRSCHCSEIMSELGKKGGKIGGKRSYCNFKFPPPGMPRKCLDILWEARFSVPIRSQTS
jgi:hypothetical protein